MTHWGSVLTTRPPDKEGWIPRKSHLFSDCTTIKRRERLLKDPVLYEHQIAEFKVHHTVHQGRIIGTRYRVRLQGDGEDDSHPLCLHCVERGDEILRGLQGPFIR